MKNILQGKLLILLKGGLKTVIIIAIFVHIVNILLRFVTTYDSRIKTKMEKLASRCGGDYFISWIAVEQSDYYFKDVIGCNPSKDRLQCSYSVKQLKLNPFYNQRHHKFDKETYDFLSAMDSGAAAFFSDPSEELSKYTTITTILNSTNKKINELGIAVTKDALNNLVSIFTITNTGETNKCSRNNIVNMLEDLSMYAKEGA